ncbi:hypothetical protein [Campylobacter ureolyticus]|uniref:AzlD domain-containing protein n=1 Tax=Campylobacter ureolyticus TaxID=827 RepID=UPI0012EB7329
MCNGNFGFLCFKKTHSNSYYAVEILSVLVCLIMQIIFKNALLSIAISTIFYMILGRV